MPITRKIEIEAWGDTEEDVELAIEEAQRRISGGNTSGCDRNDTGGFTFTITEEED